MTPIGFRWFEHRSHYSGSYYVFLLDLMAVPFFVNQIFLASNIRFEFSVNELRVNQKIVCI